MGSNYFGELGLGRGRSSPPSRKGKKSSSEKPKQPQRGLGVAQLEKIRLQNQMVEYLPSSHPPFRSNLRMEFLEGDTARLESPSSSKMASSSSDFAFHPNVMMGYGDTERIHIADGEIHSNPSSRPLSNHDNTFPPPHYAPPTVIRFNWGKTMEENSVQKKQRHDQSHSSHSKGLMNQNSEHSDKEEIDQNSEHSDKEEIDLELRL